MRHNAFTLAEVLITLMIIGIVAALTIPSVISNAEQQQFKTGLKKAVSVLNSAIQMNIAMEGETPYETDNLFNYLKRHMNIVAANSGPDRKSDIEEKYNHNWHFYTVDGMRFEFDTESDRRPDYSGKTENLRLHESGVKLNRTTSCGGDSSENDGWTKPQTSFLCNCGSYGLANNPNNTKNPPCIITVDVNGDKKPNPKNPVATDHYWEGNGAFHYTSYSYPSYTYPKPDDKKLTDVFSILITDEKAIPFGVVAQRAMYQK